MSDAIKEERFVIHNADGSISLDAYHSMSRDELKARCGELCRAIGDWQFAAMAAATDGSNTLANIREPYRSQIARLIEAYED